MSQLLQIMEELRAILKDEKQLARITDPELIQLRSLLDEQRSVLWRIEQEKAKKDRRLGPLSVALLGAIAALPLRHREERR